MSWKKRRQMRYGEPNIPFVRWLNLFFLISLLTTFFGYPSVWFFLSLITTPWLFFMCIPYMGNGFPLIFDKLVRWIFFKIKALINGFIIFRRESKHQCNNLFLFLLNMRNTL